MNIKSKIFYWYAAFVAAFLALTVLPAPDKTTLTKYHLTPTNLRALDLTIIVIEAGIWYAAFYGYQRLFRYSQLIKSAKDGRQIAKLARGLMLLAIGLPITTIISSILSVIAAHEPSFKSPSTVINNYISVLFPLIGFLWISIAARGLSQLAKTRPRLLYANVVVLIAIALGIGFCCLIVLEHKTLRSTYHMSPELIMLTLGIPYMYIWFLGLLAITELLQYSRTVAGLLYRKGWNLLIGGLTAIIFVSILLQYLTTLTSWLTSLSLGWLLLLLYVLLFLLASAYIVVALGANKLRKIEEA